MQERKLIVVPPSYKPKSMPGDPWVEPAPWKWCLGGNFVYFGAMSVVVHLASFIPDVDTGSELFQNIYYRGLVNTTYFPLSQFIGYFLLSIFGWTFVNLVTMKRGEPFTSGNRSLGSFIKLLWITPICFMTSGICTLRSVYDLDGYCTTPIVQMEPVREERMLQQESVDDVFFSFFESISQANYMFEQPQLKTITECRQYTQDEVYQFNYLFWGLAFLVGLNFTHADQGPFKHFSLDPSEMKDWGLFLWGALLAIVVFIAALLYRVFTDYRQISCLKWYLIILAAWFIGIYLQDKRMKKQNRQIHLHHYCVAFIVMSLICY